MQKIHFVIFLKSFQVFDSATREHAEAANVVGYGGLEHFQTYSHEENCDEHRRNYEDETENEIHNHIGVRKAIFFANLVEQAEVDH